jgi:tRNA(adenine34) deaminase
MLQFPDDLLPPQSGETDFDMMREAVLEAKKAWELDEVPIGAVLVKDGDIIARAHNTREKTKRPTDHAEIKVIEDAASQIEAWRLEGVTLYVTLEPCPMCAGAILQARIPRVVWGASDPKAGACETLYQLLNDARLNHSCEVLSGIHGEQCGALLSRYFKGKRLKRR